jgi:hypothetical protein
MPFYFTNVITSKNRTCTFTGLLLSLSLAAMAAAPAQARSNTDLEMFSGGMASKHPQGGYSAGQGLGQLPGAGSISIKKDALQQVTWYKARRQISIEDDGPIVTNRSSGGQGNGAAIGQGMLSPATFGGNGTMSGSINVPHNLTPAHKGPAYKQEFQQARPLMRSAQATAQGLRGGSNAPAASGPAQQKPPVGASSYGSYSSGPSVTAEGDSEASHMRQVKARLLSDNAR